MARSIGNIIRIISERRYVILCGIHVIIVGGGISNFQIITEEGKYSLDAIQNNPEIEDTLAYKLSKLYNNIYYKRGDKILEQRLWTGGGLTAGSKYIYFTIPTHFVTDATPRLNLIAVQVRHNGEYLVGDGDPSYVNFEGISIVYTYYKHTGFEVILKKDNGFTININNVPVSVNCLFSIDFV